MFTLDPSSPDPFYLQLADHIRSQIARGILKPNERLDAEVDIARELAISRGTVRQALELLVNQGLLQRTPGKGTFVTQPVAPPQSHLVGMIVPYLRDSLTTDMLRGAESLLHQSGYSLIFCDSQGDLATERSQVERLRREGIAGLILFPIAAADESAMLTELLPSSFPCVLIDRRLPGVLGDTVLIDNVGSSYAVVTHLLQQGHTRIACICPHERPSSVTDRIQGYEQALRDAGILPLAAISLPRYQPTNADVSIYPPADLAAIDYLLQVRERPTALFCINDFIAFAVMQHVLKRGFQVPEDIAIAGFDDIPLAPYMPVPLTTIAQPKYDIGAEAAHLLIEQMTGVASPGREQVLSTTLVVRASTTAQVGAENQPRIG